MSLIAFSPLQDGVTGVNAAATNTPLSTIYNDYNGNITDANVSASAAIAGSKVALASQQVLPANLGIYNYQTANAGSIANTSKGALTLQMGWGQSVGSGTTSITQAVTFPTAFTAVLGVVISPIGSKATSAAATVTGFNSGSAVNAVFIPLSITTTGFSAFLQTSSTFSASSYYGYSWVAWGIV